MLARFMFALCMFGIPKARADAMTFEPFRRHVEYALSVLRQEREVQAVESPCKNACFSA